MEIFLVPFSLLDLVLFSPIYAYIVWFAFRRIMRKKRRFTGFMTWSFIIHAAIIPLFWALHSAGVWGFVEANKTSFDPVIISGHAIGFILTYFIFCGGLTMGMLVLVKRRSA
jgi:hypothetical protein